MDEDTREFMERELQGCMSRRSRWDSTFDLLLYGDVEYVAQLLESGRPMPFAIAQLFAKALRGGQGLPFRLEVVANPKPGQKRPGRRPEDHGLRDLDLAAQMSKRMTAGATYDDAARAVASELGVGERTVKKAYSRNKNRQ